MLGLIIALLCVAYGVVVTGVTANAAVAGTLGFLWTWHMTWTVVWCVVLGIIALIGIIAMFCKGGGGFGALITFAIVPLMTLNVAIQQCLFLGAVAIASRAGLGGEHINSTYLIIAGVMYAIGILYQRSTGSTISSSANKCKS